MRNAATLLQEKRKIGIEINKAKQALNKLLEKERSLVKQIQDTCSHPVEYQLRQTINPDRDPLEAERVYVTCLACEAVLGKFDVIRGKDEPVDPMR